MTFCFGDRLEFDDSLPSFCGGGEYVITCGNCGKIRYICGYCLKAGADLCPCQPEEPLKK